MLGELLKEDRIRIGEKPTVVAVAAIPSSLQNL
jgi:hypothetical protein